MDEIINNMKRYSQGGTGSRFVYCKPALVEQYPLFMARVASSRFQTTCLVCIWIRGLTDRDYLKNVEAEHLIG